MFLEQTERESMFSSRCGILRATEEEKARFETYIQRPPANSEGERNFIPHTSMTKVIAILHPLKIQFGLKKDKFENKMLALQGKLVK